VDAAALPFGASCYDVVVAAFLFHLPDAAASLYGRWPRCHPLAVESTVK
jgi:hypothetical protein